MGRILIGTSGWAYKGWREHLYQGVPTRAWLAHASRRFDALEINGSFYGQIAAATYARWRDETPPGFVFALKGHRFVTHYKRLRAVEDSIVKLRDPARSLGDKLSVVLWQLPAGFGVDVERLDGFLRALQLWPEVRHVLEPRDRSWFCAEVADRLAAARVAACISDAPDFPMWRAVTSDLVYVRLHGHTRKYASSYSKASLERWAADAIQWSQRADVHVYFDNDAEGAAVHNAVLLRAIVDGRRASRLASAMREPSAPPISAAPADARPPRRDRGSGTAPSPRR